MSATYNYTARTTAGAFVAGSLRVESLDSAIAHLSSRALFVTSLERAGTARAGLTALFAFGSTGAAVQATFFRSLATLAAAGISLRRGLDVTIDQCRDWRFRDALRSIASDLDSGTSLSGALMKRPGAFLPLYSAMVSAGEAGGGMHDVLARIADLVERRYAMQKRLVAALTYPALVCASAICLIVFLVANVVPAFSGMFGEVHATLPFSTRMLIGAGESLHSPAMWVVLGATTMLAAGALHVALRWKRTAVLLNHAVLALPLVGSAVRRAGVARMTRTLSALLKSGVPLTPAIEAARAVLELPRYDVALAGVADELRGGQALGDVLERTRLLDPLSLALVRVGEESGALDAMFARIAEYCELDVETALSALSSALEPALIIFLGACVGTIVGSIVVPLYSVIGSIK